jgi:hypothetical protein
VLHRGRIFSSVPAFVLHAALPVLGVVVDLYLLWRSFFVELWGQGWGTGRSVIVFDVTCAALALLVLLRHPHQPGRQLTSTAKPPGAAQ